jgi:RimJ/RimL family protein N-acetyltransferase
VTATGPPERFVTDRLVLRRLTQSDAAAVYEYGRDPEVTRYVMFPTHRSIADAEAFLRASASRWESGEEYGWLIMLAGEQRGIGSIGCRVRGHAVDIGYVLARTSWRRGYATEAGRAIVAWAVARPEIHRVWAFCDVDNLASARVLEKLGMSREGVLRRWTVHPNVSAEPRDCYVYARVRGEPAQPSPSEAPTTTTGSAAGSRTRR